MKRKNNLYEQTYELKNIMTVFNEVCRNTRNKKKVRVFKEYKCINISKIYNTLKNKKYEVGPYNVFTIYEPKERRIVSQNMFDKTINHLVARYILMPAILPCLIENNVASRKGKGTKLGLELHKEYNRICKVKYGTYYILKCDVTKYFASIDHDILKQKLARRIKDKDALEIVGKIIDSEENGLGIGNMTSQVLAIFYLNDMDHYIKEELKIKYYIRYQDDFILLHESKEYLKECLEKIRIFLGKEKLVLNRKTRIYRDTNNYVFLGRSKKNEYIKYRSCKRKLKGKIYKYRNGYINLNSLLSSINSYENLTKKKFVIK
ncbi:MAG: RNA-directed DNA polymerase [Clostridiales bacterium]|nr:RNA-directed DNA polymerase [Clostridiales bacterium]